MSIYSTISQHNVETPTQNVITKMPSSSIPSDTDGLAELFSDDEEKSKNVKLISEQLKPASNK